MILSSANRDRTPPWLVWCLWVGALCAVAYCPHNPPPSASPSQSPSISRSPSRSPTVSHSPSQSPTVSVSPSTSLSPSASLSPRPPGAWLNVSVTTAGATYRLPLGGAVSGRRLLQSTFSVDWGDGSAVVQCNNNGQACSHTFAASGFYFVRLMGSALGWSMLYATGTRCADFYPNIWLDEAGQSCPQYQFETAGSSYSRLCSWYAGAWYAWVGGLGAAQACCACGGGTIEPAEPAGAHLVAIEDWGDIELHPTAGRHLQNLVALERVAPLPAHAGLKSLYRSFSGLDSLAAVLDVSALDTSAVTDAAYVFAESFLLDTIGLGAWNTSAVTDLSFAFAVTNGSFPGVGQWNTRSLLNATAAFNHAMGFTQDLAAWDVRGLQLWDNLLQGAELYTHGLSSWAMQLPPGRSACLWAFTRTRVREQARAALCEPEFVFIVNSGYGGRPTLKYLDPAVVTSIPAHTFTVDWGDGSSVQTCTQSPGTASCTKNSAAYIHDQVFTVRIRGDVHGLRKIGSSDMSVVAINSWGNVSLTTAESSFEPDHTSYSGNRNMLFYVDQWSDLSSLSYFAPIAGTQALRYVDAFQVMFSTARSLVGDLRDWDIPLKGSLSRMLAGTRMLNQPLYWNTTAVTDLYQTFSSAASFNGDISGWDTSSVVSMGGLFKDTQNFNVDISGWNVGKVTDTEFMLLRACGFHHSLAAWPLEIRPAVLYCGAG